MTVPSPEEKYLSPARSARLLYDLYQDVARECLIDLPLCDFPEKDKDVTAESLAGTSAWFLEVDRRIPVHQLRQFLQTHKLVNQESLRAILDHHLHKSDRGTADRDKIDFLLTQLFCGCASSQLSDDAASIEFVARTLEPVLGTVEAALPESLHQLEEIIASASACHSLQELFASGILERGRNLKAAAGDDYFAPKSMVAFTRFNFVMRRVFFRLVHQDLNAILEGLRQLEQRGVEILDCRAAEFSADEPIGRLRMICQSWKVMFQAEYATGQPLRLLVDLRGVIDSNLASQADEPGKKPQDAPALRARAAAASASGDSRSSGDAARPSSKLRP